MINEGSWEETAREQYEECQERVMPRSQMKETFQRGGSNHLCQMLLMARNEDRKCTIGVSCLEFMGDLCGEMKMKPGLEGVQKRLGGERV